MIYATIQEMVLSQQHEHLKPEFMNRMDEMIVFMPLLPAQISEIVLLQFNRLFERMRAKGIQAEITEKARSIIASASWDPIYGTRPVKRMIQKRILNPLAMEILSGKFVKGDNIIVDEDNGSIIFKKS